MYSTIDDMKKILLLFTGIALCASLQAQTTAKDWWRTSCDGFSHHLFDELDSQHVIVLEFVMMNCSPCVTAANGLTDLIAPYKTTHPGRVHLYSIGFIDSYTCEDMKDWSTFNGFKHPLFVGGQSEVAYYGGMGMPTIVVVANDSHHVFYKKQGYASSHNDAITRAINQALNIPTGIEETATAPVRIYPNPAADELHIDLPQTVRNGTVIITDLSGRQVMKTTLNGQNPIQVSDLRPGVYFLELFDENTLVGHARFIRAE